MNSELKRHYQSLYDRHGRSHSAVQYSSEQSQRRRFDLLLEVCPHVTSILDIGCGLGDILPVVREIYGEECEYIGIDFVDEFIADAKQYYAEDKNARFITHDIASEPLDVNVEYTVLSGIFNNRMDDNWEFIKVTLQRMWNCSSRGIAFNALSTYVDYQDEHLHYQDPLVLFDYCKRNLSQYVCLRHDYDVKSGSIPFEYTIWVYR